MKRQNLPRLRRFRIKCHRKIHRFVRYKVSDGFQGERQIERLIRHCQALINPLDLRLDTCELLQQGRRMAHLGDRLA
jgi:hypothetical protein